MRSSMQLSVRRGSDLKDELGDLFLQVLFYSQMAAEAGYFTISDVAAKPECEVDSAASACLWRWKS